MDLKICNQASSLVELHLLNLETACISFNRLPINQKLFRGLPFHFFLDSFTQLNFVLSRLVFDFTFNHGGTIATTCKFAKIGTYIEKLPVHLNHTQLNEEVFHGASLNCIFSFSFCNWICKCILMPFWLLQLESMGMHLPLLLQIWLIIQSLHFLFLARMEICSWHICFCLIRHSNKYCQYGQKLVFSACSKW